MIVFWSCLPQCDGDNFILVHIKHISQQNTLHYFFMSIWKIHTVLPCSDVRAWILITLSPTINRNLEQLIHSVVVVEVDDAEQKAKACFLRVRPILILKAFRIFIRYFYDFNQDRAIQISSMTNCNIFINMYFIPFITNYVLTFITLNLIKMLSMYDCSIFKQLIN